MSFAPSSIDDLGDGLLNSTGGTDPSYNFLESTTTTTSTSFPIQYPIFHIFRPAIIPGVSDRYLSLISPFVLYWIVSLLFATLDWIQLPFFEKYRIHESEEITKRNTVTRWEVVKSVLIQQFFQTALGLWWIDEDVDTMTGVAIAKELLVYNGYLARVFGIVLGQDGATTFMKDHGVGVTNWVYWWGVPFIQFTWAFFVLDTWQYFLHRYFHTNRFLYRHIHAIHHRLYVPYAYGALYNHPLEGFLFDSLGAVVAESLSFMSVRQTTLLFALSSAKTVDDHCGYKIPFDPLQALFGNNADYHDIHHQVWGIKKNFAQPWFTHWDEILGTRMTRAQAPVRSQRAVLNNVKKPTVAPNGNVTEVANSGHAPSSSESDRSSERGEPIPVSEEMMTATLKATGSSVRPEL